MMAAYAAGEAGHRVLLLEKNEKPGKKLYITGKGRCNFTNDCTVEEFLGNVVSNPKFLYSALQSFTPQDMKAFLTRFGCEVKVERGRRAFPASDKASDVTAAMVRAMKQVGVEIRYGAEAREVNITQEADPAQSVDITQESNPGYSANSNIAGVDSVLVGITSKPGAKNTDKTSPVCTGVTLADGSVIPADHVIVATGGLSYPATGSTGDGLEFAKAAGLKLTDCAPSLVPFAVREPWVRELQGLSLKNVTLTLGAGKKRFSEQGELLFTHFGISGPLVLSASAKITSFGKEGIPAYIDLKPALSEEKLDLRLQRDFSENQNKSFHNALDGLLPKSMIPVMVRLSGIDPEKKVHSVTKQEREKLKSILKALPLTVTGTRGYPEAVITRGGVSVKEIDPKTMQAKKVKGLSFCGEVLDLDALTGGYNLQIAWSTGYAAGRGI